MSELPYVTEQTFQDEVVASSQPVLVDVTAVWCAPCKMLDPLVRQVAVELDDRIKVVKIDADQNPGILMQYGILGIPTLMLFKGGYIKERMTGFIPKDRLMARLSPHLV
jgi:thioredoxin 1